ncbi:phosphoribosylaminoimidazolesuccinocarboxamide synthase, partial [bacterium]|nr:phosphoribosylaminoimidazolesuccinocarboxamide synthase [bacterium]
MGSVKDLKIIEEATQDNPGQGRFIYSDRYSVFDWGEMPDQIPYKGMAITLLGAHFFEKLEKMGIATHYKGLVEDGTVKRLSEIKNPTNTMEIELLRVIRPELKDNKYNYSIYRGESGGFLIPLEVIYRNSLPLGSSVFRRLKDGEILFQDLGLDSEPIPNQKLDRPILDVSTKLEITDRYLTWAEAQQISSLSDTEITKLKELAETINDLITDEFATIGLVNEDGKIEVGFNSERSLMLVDVLGTLDECRFTYNELPVSKEIARIYYRDTEW